MLTALSPSSLPLPQMTGWEVSLLQTRGIELLFLHHVIVRKLKTYSQGLYLLKQSCHNFEHDSLESFPLINEATNNRQRHLNNDATDL